MKIAYVSRNDGSDVRIIKECRSLLKHGYDVSFVGWSSMGRPRSGFMPEMPRYVYTSGSQLTPFQKIRQFPSYVLHVWRSLRQIRPDIVHCVNEELGIVCVVCRIGLSYQLICDLFDSILLVWGSRFPTSVAARQIAHVVYRSADLLIVTDEARLRRLGRYSSKARVVGNFPVDPGFVWTQARPDESSPIRLYVAGTLAKDRGLTSLLELLNTRSDVTIISAGWTYDNCAREFIEHPRVEFLGVLSPEESLHAAAKCHAIVALYEPSNECKILASPNKVYDALSIGRAVIVNRETLISRAVSKEGMGYVVSYGSLEELSRVVDLLKNGSTDPELAWHRRRLFETRFTWDIAESNLIEAYATLHRPRRRDPAAIPAN